MKPQFLKPLFWDIDFEKLDVKKYPRYVIERILEYGDLKHVRWMFKTYPKRTIVETVKKSRQLSLKSANFWADYYHIPKDEVLCLTKSFREIQRSIWPY